MPDMEGGVDFDSTESILFQRKPYPGSANECVAAHTQGLPEDRLRDVCAYQKTTALSASSASSKGSAAAGHPVNHRKVPAPST